MDADLLKQFYLGAKVRCVVAPDATSKTKNLPVTGEVYTVRELLFSNGEPGCRLVEVNNDVEVCLRGKTVVQEEPGFLLSRFSPCVAPVAEILA